MHWTINIYYLNSTDTLMFHTIVKRTSIKLQHMPARHNIDSRLLISCDKLLSFCNRYFKIYVLKKSLMK